MLIFASVKASATDGSAISREALEQDLQGYDALHPISPAAVLVIVIILMLHRGLARCQYMLARPLLLFITLSIP